LLAKDQTLDVLIFSIRQDMSRDEMSCSRQESPFATICFGLLDLDRALKIEGG